MNTKSGYAAIIGLPNVGKSTLFNTVRKLLGDYGKATGFNTFDADNRNQYGNDIAALKESRFVFASESESERRLAEAPAPIEEGAACV